MENFEAPLLLATTYNLNYSETKRITVGLQVRASGDVTPVVKLQHNNSSGGITFESTKWCKLQDALTEIASYFGACTNYGWKADQRIRKTLNIDDCEIHFASSFGSKSIVFDQAKDNVIAVDVNPNDENTQLEAPPPQKKKKKNIYSPSIVMQKKSFDGLCIVTPCVDERFRRLQRYVVYVKNCIDVLCAELVLHIPAKELIENVDQVRIKTLLTQNSSNLCEAVRHRVDPSFLEHFDILFLELQIFCVPFITQEVKKLITDISLVASKPFEEE